jgi:hypothetical protein
MVRRIGVSALAAVLVGMFWVGSAVPYRHLEDTRSEGRRRSV